MNIKKSQKLLIRFYGSERDKDVVIRCKYKSLPELLDINSLNAVEQALAAIFVEPCRGISAKFNNKDIQVDLLD
jgi:hypothetical protein